jgi:hypothetical protein
VRRSRGSRAPAPLPHIRQRRPDDGDLPVERVDERGAIAARDLQLGLAEERPDNLDLSPVALRVDHVHPRGRDREVIDVRAAVRHAPVVEHGNVWAAAREHLGEGALSLGTRAPALLLGDQQLFLCAGPHQRGDEACGSPALGGALAPALGDLPGLAARAGARCGAVGKARLGHDGDIGSRRVIAVAHAPLVDGRSPHPVAGPGDSTSTSTTTGAWSEGFEPLRASRSMYASRTREASPAPRSTRSIRIPQPLWNMPAR